MKVAIAGYGIEGEVNYAYWRKLGHEVTIVDEAAKPAKRVPDGAKVLLGENVFQKLHDFDLVVRTASLPPNAIVTDGTIWSSTNEFFAHCPAQIIGVTGTKGKGTTSSLIASILQETDREVHLVGNIGRPALAVLPDIRPEDVVVFELSSFQLWDLRRSPHVAVVLMIEPDHLDVHADFKDYIRAKSNIRRHQKSDDVCFYHPSNKWSEEIAKSSVLGDRVRYDARDAGGVYAEQDMFRVQGENICSISALRLPGKHNVENACAAISAARVFTVDNNAIQRGLHNFTGLPHRLKFVREVRGVKYYDDNYSSAPGAVGAAIAAFDEPEVLICGGYDRSLSYHAMAKRIAEQPNMKHVLLIGQTKYAIAKELALLKFNNFTVLDAKDMPSIVAAAAQHPESGDIVIMSPGCASFDMFTNFTDRGEQFVHAVERL